MRRLNYACVLGFVLATLAVAGSVSAEHPLVQLPIGQPSLELTAEPLPPTVEPPSQATEIATATPEVPTPTDAALPTATEPLPVATATAATPIATTLPPTATRTTNPALPGSTPTAITMNGSPPTHRSVPLPDSMVAGAPLSLAQRVSVSSASIGMEVEYTVHILGSQVGTLVELHNLLPAELDILSVTPSTGQCRAGNELVCQLSLDPNGALIVIRARVSDRAIVGTSLTAQAAAQDSTSFTAASDLVSLLIVDDPSAALAANTAPDGQPASASTAHGSGEQAAQPGQLDAVEETGAHSAGSARLSPDAPTRPPAANVDRRSGDAIDQTSAEPSAADIQDAPLPAGDGEAQSSQALPGAVLGMPERSGSAIFPEAAAGAQYAAATLPTTATGSVVGGWLVGMLGLALAASGLRRVRRAALQLDDRRIEQLAPLVRALKRSMQREIK